MADRGAVVVRRAGRSETPRCPYCFGTIRELDVIWSCPACETLHHSECADENGRCTLLGCRGQPASSRGRESPAAGWPRRDAAEAERRFERRQAERAGAAERFARRTTERERDAARAAAEADATRRLGALALLVAFGCLAFSLLVGPGLSTVVGAVALVSGVHDVVLGRDSWTAGVLSAIEV